MEALARQYVHADTEECTRVEVLAKIAKQLDEGAPFVSLVSPQALSQAEIGRIMFEKTVHYLLCWAGRRRMVAHWIAVAAAARAPAARKPCAGAEAAPSSVLVHSSTYCLAASIPRLSEDTARMQVAALQGPLTDADDDELRGRAVQLVAQVRRWRDHNRTPCAGPMRRLGLAIDPDRPGGLRALGQRLHRRSRGMRRPVPPSPSPRAPHPGGGRRRAAAPGGGAPG